MALCGSLDLPGYRGFVCGLVVLFSLFLVGTVRIPAGECSIYREESPDLLMFTIRIPMTAGEQVLVAFPDGTSKEMGKVRSIPIKSKYPAFTASKYGIGGQVIATASNAHHLQISTENGVGRTLSLIPSQTFVAVPGFGTSFVVEGIGGSGLWGKYAPFVGSPVYIVNQAGMPVPFNDIGMLQFARFVEIKVYRPKDLVDYIEIENRPGGRAWYRDAGGDHDFAVVERGVSGTGRFEGSLYQGKGLVRANHPGVICVSTTIKSDIGGFQIVPINHTYSKEMQKTRHMAQYIVLRGVGFEDLTGRPPFFKNHIRPGDLDEHDSEVGHVMAKINGEWGPIPEISGLTDGTLSDVEAFRIFLR